MVVRLDAVRLKWIAVLQVQRTVGGGHRRREKQPIRRLARQVARFRRVLMVVGVMTGVMARRRRVTGVMVRVLIGRMMVGRMVIGGMLTGRMMVAGRVWLVDRQTTGLTGAFMRRRRWVVVELQKATISTISTVVSAALPTVAEWIKFTEISMLLLVDPVRMIRRLAFHRVVVALSAVALQILEQRPVLR